MTTRRVDGNGPNPTLKPHPLPEVVYLTCPIVWYDQSDSLEGSVKKNVIVCGKAARWWGGEIKKVRR